MTNPSRRLTPFQRQCRALSERDVQKAYVAAARSLGFLVAHHYDSRFSDEGTKGFPDLTLTHPKGVTFFVEWKRWDGIVSGAQADWHRCLRASGHTVEVYWPMSWEQAMLDLEVRVNYPISPELRAFPQPKKKARRRTAGKPAAPTSPSSPA